MPNNKVLFIACLDTKEEVVRYFVDSLAQRGLEVLIADVSTGNGAPCMAAYLTKEEIAKAAGTDFDAVAAMDQYNADEVMLAGIKLCTKKLLDQNLISGALGIGGSNGTMIASAAMREMPVGMPKIIVSAMANGTNTFGQYVGSKDIVIIPSVADILTVNRISKRIFDNAIASLSAMLQVDEGGLCGAPMVGLSMLGQTTQAGMHGLPIFKRAGYDLAAFHANGSGGRALEACAKRGDFAAVWELTPHEIGDELFSKIHTAGPDRMEQAADQGIPILLVPGCVDFFYGHRRLLGQYVSSRQTFDCNNETILIKITEQEAVQVGEVLAAKLNSARGKTAVVFPMGGISRYDRPQSPFYSPEIDRIIHDTLRERLSRRTEFLEIDAHINDPIVGRTCAEMLVNMLSNSR